MYATQRMALKKRNSVHSQGESSCTLRAEILFVQRAFCTYSRGMTRQQVLDLYFMEMRAKLIDIAAFLDRAERAQGEADFRLTAFVNAVKHLGAGETQRARNVLLSLSDPTTEPIPAATTKAACGAWPGTN